LKQLVAIQLNTFSLQYYNTLLNNDVLLSVETHVVAKYDDDEFVNNPQTIKSGMDDDGIENWQYIHSQFYVEICFNMNFLLGCNSKANCLRSAEIMM